MAFQPKNVKPKEEFKKTPFYKRSLGGISAKEVLFMTKNLLILYKSGSTLLEGLEVLSEQAKGSLKVTLKDMGEYLQKGNFFADALAQYPKTFSPMYVSLVRIGESSGTLEENLEYLVQQLEANMRLKQKVKSAMFYPAMILVAVISLALAISYFILPKLTKLFANFKVELPLSTRIVLGFAEFMQDHGTLFIIGVFFGSIAVYKLLRWKKMHPVTHWVLLHLPLTKTITQHINLTVFCRTMGILLATGVTINKGLVIAEDTVQNYYYKKFVADARKSIEAGSTLTDSLKGNRSLFSPTDAQVIGVGERSGTLSDSLNYCADVHQTMAEDFTKNLVTILEPMLLIMVGVMVGTLALSIITPIYSITSSLRK